MLSIDFETVFSWTRGLITDPNLAQLEDLERDEIQTEWLLRSLSDPRITNLFSYFMINDEEMNFQVELKNPSNDYADKLYIIELLATGMAIAWLQPRVDSILNVAPMIGNKEEKMLLNNHKYSIERLKSLKIQQHKMIRDRGYINNSYLNGE